MRATSSKRDPRLDFFRGAALFMIFFDHLDSEPLSWLTYKRIGFSDAAEIFVFLSGMSCGIAYSRILNREGWKGLASAAAKRTAYLYFACVMTGVITNVLVAAVNARTENQDIHLAFTDVASNFLLVNLPPLASILTAYIAFTFVVVPLYFLISRVDDFAALIVSGAVWAIGFLYFDFIGVSVARLLCWQFLFVIGVFVGTNYYGDRKSRSLPSNNYFLYAAWAIVVSSFVCKSAHHLHELDWSLFSEDMKWHLHPLRLIHFLSVAYLVAAYIKETSVFFGTAGAIIVTYVGRHSLPVFCATAIFTEVLNALLRGHPASFTDRIAVDACLIAIFWLACVKVQKIKPIAA